MPTSSDQEDHVSVGTIAARKACEILANAKNVVPVELLCAAKGLDLFTNLKPGEVALANQAVAPGIAAMHELVRSDAILATVEAKIGALT